MQDVKFLTFAVARRLLVAACDIQFPDQESNLGPVYWELGVLATRPPGKSGVDKDLLRRT